MQLCPWFEGADWGAEVSLELPDFDAMLAVLSAEKRIAGRPVCVSYGSER